MDRAYVYRCPGSVKDGIDSSVTWDARLVTHEEYIALKRDGWRRSIADAVEAMQERALEEAEQAAAEPKAAEPAELAGLAEAVAAGFKDDARWGAAKRAEKLAEWLAKA